MLVYVGDIVIAGSTPTVVDRLVQSFVCEFSHQRLGPVGVLPWFGSVLSFRGHDIDAEEVCT